MTSKPDSETECPPQECLLSTYHRLDDLHFEHHGLPDVGDHRAPEHGLELVPPAGLVVRPAQGGFVCYLNIGVLGYVYCNRYFPAITSVYFMLSFRFMFGVTEESISREFYVTDDGEKSACLNSARVISEEMAKSGIYGNLSQMKRSASAVQWTGQQDMRHSKRHVTVTAHGPILTTQKIPVGRVTDGEWVTEC